MILNSNTSSTSQNLQSELWTLDTQELKRRPVEHGLAIDWVDTKRVDDALHVALFSDPQDPDETHEVKVHIADTGILLAHPVIWQQAIDVGFTRVIENGEERTTKLPIRLFDLIGLNADHKDVDGTSLGAPSITFRYLCDQYGRTSQFDIYKTRVLTEFCCGEDFDQRLIDGDEAAVRMAKVATYLGKRIRPAEPLPVINKSHEVLARLNQVVGQLAAASMNEAGIPWIYRANPEGNKARLVDLDAEEIEETVVDLLTAMGAAQYTTEPLRHLTLGYAEFSHVTSPLRRDADFINSLILHAVLSGKEIPFTVNELDSLAHKMNEKALERIKERIRQESARVAAKVAITNA